jgi:hypothetical protein
MRSGRTAIPSVASTTARAVDPDQLVRQIFLGRIQVLMTTKLRRARRHLGKELAAI